MQLITSRTNLKIKQIRALREHKFRQEARLFLVEGIRHVGEAVQAGVELEGIYFSPELLTSDFALALIEEQAERGVDCFSLPGDLFTSLADKENPQGILAVVRQPEITLEDLKTEQAAWNVALVSPQDPGNVGTILRTIDAVGADGLILVDSRLDPYHPAAVRASMGTLFHHPVVQSSFLDFSQWARRNGYYVYGSSRRADVDYMHARPYLMPRILLLGSEREGLTDEQRMMCEKVVCLPMYGHATSLNLAVAAGVLLYAMLN